MTRIPNGQTQEEKDFTGIIIMTTILWVEHIYLPDSQRPMNWTGMWKGGQHNLYKQWMQFFDASPEDPRTKQHPLYKKALEALEENQRKRKQMTTRENVWKNISGRIAPVGPFAQEYDKLVWMRETDKSLVQPQPKSQVSNVSFDQSQVRPQSRQPAIRPISLFLRYFPRVTIKRRRRTKTEQMQNPFFQIPVAPFVQNYSQKPRKWFSFARK
jgi:hypothetical protein